MAGSDIDGVIVRAIEAPIEARLEMGRDRATLVLGRALPYDTDELWLMLTDPRRLARWSPVVPDRALTVPGPATSRENPGDDAVDVTVLEAEPPRLLVHRWGDDVLRWAVGGDEHATLELRQTLADPAVASSLAAGWRICLGTLAALADGPEHERVVGQRAMDYGWQALRDRYETELTVG